MRKFKQKKFKSGPRSDNAVVAMVISMWAFIILVMITLAIFVLIFTCRKTSSAISSYQEWRVESKETKAAEKVIREKEETIAKEKRVVVSKKAEKKKVEAARKEKVKVKKIDPVTGGEDQGDTYTLLVMFLFFVGVSVFFDLLLGTHGPGSFILCIIGLIVIVIVWSW